MNECCACGKKFGFISLSKVKLKDGLICDKCLEPFGFDRLKLSISDTMKAEAAAKEMGVGDFKEALNGNSEKHDEICKMLGINPSTNADTNEEAIVETPTMESLQETIKNEGCYKFNGGIGDILKVYEDRIAISREGVLNFFIMGMAGEKTIYLSDVTSVQFKKAGDFTNGYIQFSLPGGKEAQGGVFNATSDENTISFLSDRNETADIIVNYINNALRRIKSPATALQPTVINQVSTADELIKFKSLLDAGVLTQEEFDKKKAELLG